MAEQILTSEYIKSIFPVRVEASNKSTYGKVFNIVGSKNYVGAGFISSLASVSVGAGYSILACPESLLNIYAVKTSDLVFYPYNDNQLGCLSDEVIDNDFIEKALSSDIILIGCGLGNNEKTFSAIKKFLDIIKVTQKIVILDADALNAIAGEGLQKLPKNTVITPHPMEAQRLLGVDKNKILISPEKYAVKLADKYGAVTVLKTHRTVIATRNGDIYINQGGNSALAKAGTGDVLAGMIAGYSAQTKNPLSSALLGVYMHSKIAEIYAQKNSEYTLLPSKMLDYVDIAMKSL